MQLQQTAVRSGPNSFQRMALAALAAVAATLTLSAFSPPKADAAYYNWQPYCPHGEYAGGMVWLPPGQGCVGPIKPRIVQLMGGQFGAPAEAGQGNHMCVVGKSEKSIYSATTYPINCTHGSAVYGAVISGGVSGWPYLWNEGPSYGYMWGQWRGYFG
jgi:hypothetical protein